VDFDTLIYLDLASFPVGGLPGESRKGRVREGGEFREWAGGPGDLRRPEIFRGGWKRDDHQGFGM
jgi:hypothetical protein